jgi:hypothetical protein
MKSGNDSTRQSLVAQIFNLLYRRIVFCARGPDWARLDQSPLRRFQIGDTAGCKPALRRRHLFTALLLFTSLTAKSQVVETHSPPPKSPRALFNAGTKNLHESKLREAETFLESAVASQDLRVQSPALYNLGNVRVAQGAEILKQSPPAGASSLRGQSAAQGAEAAAQSADAALTSDEVEKMVAAYTRGRGARRELREATEAVKRAMAAHGATLAKWQRASGDFKSAVELNPKDSHARDNADTTDGAIASLVDKLNQLQQAMKMMNGAKQKLGEKMKALKGRIPEPLAPPGAPGDEEEDEEQEMGLKPGQKEGESRDGEEIPVSADEAGQILNGFKLGGDRHLPMGFGTNAPPRDRKGRNW